MKYLNKLFILVVVAMICISATVITTTVVKPALPTSTVVFYGDPDSVKGKILSYVTKGYIVKAMSQSQAGNAESMWATCIVVMERY